MRFIGYLLLLALLGYGLWPFWVVYRIDDRLAELDARGLAPYVDLPAIRANYKARLDADVNALLPATDPGKVLDWLRQNIDQLGDAALEQAITLPWVHQRLREAVSTATGQSPAYLIAGVDYAFFERHDRLLIRIGKLGLGETHVRLTREGREWRITDIIP
ncbi:MAG: DUF2939 domain-containing protein [Chromatiaceae bacterium]|nr:DUF2939 domain-containing protein [Chromatiaceae bacterium]